MVHTCGRIDALGRTGEGPDSDWSYCVLVPALLFDMSRSH